MIEQAISLLGAMGFLTVFQLIGAWFLSAMWKSGVEYYRTGTIIKAFPGLFFGILFSLFFSFLPVFMMQEFGGPFFALLQTAVLTTLTLFFILPSRSIPAGESVLKSSTERVKSLFITALLKPSVVPVDYSPAAWQKIIPALGCFLTAIAYLMALADDSIAEYTGAGLALLVGVEFLVIHSFPFLTFITLPRLTERRWKIVQWWLFSTWFCLYLGFVLKIGGGLWGIAAFTSATVITYLGFILHTDNPHRILELIVRWFFTFIAFIVCGALTGSEDQLPASATYYHGMLYFLVLGILELSGIYRLDFKSWYSRFQAFTAASKTNVP